MSSTDQLSDHELLVQAREWRRRSLRGDRDARGIAHELEREVRSRTKKPSVNTDARHLDMLPLEVKQERSRSTWRFW